MEARARSRTTWIFATALVVLAVLGVLSSRDLGRYSESNAQVLHSHEVIASLDRLLARLEQAETSQRGFVITGEERYLSSYRSAVAHASLDLNYLRRLVGEDGPQQRVDQLSGLIGLKLESLHRGIEVRREKGFQSAVQHVLSGSGIMSQLRREIAALKREEEWRLRERSLEADENGLLTAWLSFAGGMLALLMVAIAGGAAGRSSQGMARAHGMLDMALSASGAGVWTWDVLADRISGSEQAAHLLGLGALTPHTTFADLHRLVLAEDRPILERQIQQARESRREMRYEVRVAWPEGSIHWIAGSGRFFYDSSGRPVRMAGILMDVSERKRAEEELRRAREASEAAERRAAFLADIGTALATSLDFETTLWTLVQASVPRVADYGMLYLREGSGELHLVALAHGNPAREPLLRRLGELHHPAEDSPNSLLARALQNQPLLLSEVDLSTARSITDDSEMLEIFQRLQPRSTLVLPLAARGQILGVLSLVTSESGRRYGDDDLRMGMELARRAALAVDNARLYGEAREANASKDRFLAVLSHELRTPLTPVLATVSNLESQGRIPAGLRSEMAMIRRNVELEARLIDDLLDLTRIARGKLELTREISDTRAVLEHAIQICWGQGGAEGRLSLRLDFQAADYRVWADASRLTQVFWNLLNNAVKFTPAGGTVTVRSWNEGGGEARWLVLEVADTGIGIEPEMLPRIFNAFEQGNRSVTRQFGGMGLGLAVSKAIVELHGGSLAVGSLGRGKGATFTLRLPMADLSTQSAEPQADRPLADTLPARAPELALPEAADGAPHILLIEDHVDTAQAMSELLRILGYRVSLAGTVAEALTLAESASHGHPGDGQIDLVVSDLGLPDGTGFDLMRELVDRYRLRGIALSGYGMEEDIRRSRESGFAKHLTKPVNPQALQSALRQLVEN
jgi:signal transduction histidine kinase/CHASE3 domain sensor protein/ActR/RegA family two-component response regulator